MSAYPWSRALVTDRTSVLGGRFVALLSGAGVEVVTIDADLTAEGAVRPVEERLEVPESGIDLLVNVPSHAGPGRFVDVDADELERQMALRVTAVLRLTHAALQSMTANGRGAVLNVASVGGLIPTPFDAVHGASNAFVISHAESLNFELRKTNVSVTALVPDAELDGASAGVAARAGLAAAVKGQALCVPTCSSRAFLAATGPLPRFVKRRLTGLGPTPAGRP